MAKITKLSIFSLITLSLCSCITSSDYLIVEDGPVTCGWEDVTIEFLQKSTKPSYTKVAVVEAKEVWWAYASWDDLRQALCKEAATVEADAIIEITTAKSRYDASFGMVGTAGDSKELKGIAIRYSKEMSPTEE